MSTPNLEDAKKVIRSILIPLKSGCLLTEFRREYCALMGPKHPIPSREFGFGRDDVAFLRSMPDVVRLEPWGTDFYLTAVADETTRHIQKMVEKQKPQKRKMARPAPRWRQPLPPRFEHPPRFFTQHKSVPRAFQVRIVDMVRKQQEISLTDFLSSFERCYGEKFTFQSFGFFTLQECIEAIPELTMRTVDNRILVRCLSSLRPSSQTGPRSVPLKAQPQVVGGSMPKTPVEKKAQIPGITLSGKKPPFRPAFTATAPEATPSAATAMSYVILEGEKPMKQSLRDKPDDHFSSGNQLLNSPAHLKPKENIQTPSKDTGIQFPPVSFTPKENTITPTKNHGTPVSSTPKENTPAKNHVNAEVSSPATVSLSSPLRLEPEEIPPFVLNNLKKIAAMYPQGIWATDFPALYEDVIKTDFDLYSLGYNDLSLFIDAVPHIFKREEIGDVKNNWFIVPTDTLLSKGSNPNSSAELVTSVVNNTKRILEAYPEGVKIEEFLHIYSINCSEPLNLKMFGFNNVETFLSSVASRVPLRIATSTEGKTVHLVQIPVERVFHFAPSPELVPPDAVIPPTSIPTVQLPDEMDYSKYFEVYTSSIESPSLFYIQLKGPLYSEAMNTLYNNMESFYYSPEGERYKMRNAHIKVGAVCVALWPADQHWYRVRVVSITSMESVKVFYFDYGTREEIPTSMLRYMRKEYSRLPAQALVSSLAYLVPAQGASAWDPRARALMLRLCLDIPLMANISGISNGGVLSLILCDTNQNKDTYINDVLLNEGLADCPEATPPQPSQTQQEALRALQAQLFMQACASVVAPPELAKVFQDLSLNVPPIPRPQPPQTPVNDPYMNTSSSTENEVFGDDDDKFFDQFYSKVVTVMKRYVKRVMTQDGYTFHILILDGRPYVSCGDISNLIWSGQDSDYLVQRLQNREVKLPSLTVSETDHKELFKQIRRFFVKGCQKVGDVSQIFVYSLDSLIEMLNLFGQPSEELRKRIQGELVCFNPRDPQWQELSEAEFPESEDVNIVTDDDKLNRLCLYDLLAMKESIRIRRTNRMHQGMLSSSVDEMGKMEQLLDRVVDRIEQIKKICQHYK